MVINQKVIQFDYDPVITFINILLFRTIILILILELLY